MLKLTGRTSPQNGLMEVVDGIAGIAETECGFPATTYKAVVDFITWYNSNVRTISDAPFIFKHFTQDDNHMSTLS